MINVFGWQMDFHDEMVNVVEIFDRQSPQSRPLSSFNIDLQLKYVFL
jgi:hypothetical protein